MEDAAKLAAWITRAVAVGELHPRVGHEAAYSLRAFQTMVEKQDLLREIEAR